ncbi:tubulin monoglutamylase TTLL4 [Salminus brasiliensis]|uniref:tubulin monoglutamylase TTLL4 n=1 Tax=Salminus brasiliensis TaxID=930266 RepID=UPI003B8311E3
MASSGAEDLRGGAPLSGLIVQAKSAIVHSSNTNVSSSLTERKRHRPTADSDSVALPNVTVVYDRHSRISGISSQRAYTSVPTAATSVTKPECARSAGARSDRRTASAVSQSSRHISSPSTVCHSPCHLEPSVHSYQSCWQLDKLRLRSRLLGKRAFSPQLSVCPSCPSPPKTTSRRASVRVEKTMPTNQSYPWTSNKLKSNSKGVIQPSTAKVPTNARKETCDLEKPSTILSASCCNGGDKGDGKANIIKPTQTTVPLKDKYADVPQNHVSGVQDWIPYEKTVAEDAKENERIAGCCLEHGTSEAPQRVRKVSSEVEFTAAVKKLTNNMAHAQNGTLNGLCGPLRANISSLLAVKTGTVTGATSSTKASRVCLINGNEESLMDTDTSSALSLDARDETYSADAPCDAETQRSTCAIPEEISHKMAPPQSPTVYSVTDQISAIHLTKKGYDHTSEEDPGICPMTLDEEGEPGIKGHKNVVMQEDGEENLPDELENDCSGNDHEGSDCDASSATSVATSSNIEEPVSPELEDDRVAKPALVPSLFPFMSPTLYFSTASEKVELLPFEQRKLLKWKMSTVTPNIVKHTVARSHFKVTKRSHDWLGCWGHHMKSPGFRAIREYQKLNHFPGSFQIGRKDRLWRNLSKMQARFGKREFGFFPRSFVLPQDMKLLRKAWEDGGSRQKWIIKPPASARGIGIQVIHKWSQMPRKRPLLVQKYLHKPYLISGNKFDLRIYVYVTSYDPLRIYIFNDGLVRFASCKYSSSMKSLSNKFMHLTNYSVNKKNSEYQTNSDDKACQGHKWALKALWQYLGSKGVNTTLIWEKIKDMVIKTIIASDPYVNSLVKMHLRSPYSCHELFGFDIMLDENLKPWVLEVNISPSLHSNSALDVSIKGQMIRDVLNLAGFVLPHKDDVIPPGSSDSSSTSSLCGGVRERSRSDLSADEKVKRAFYLTQRFGDQDFYTTVLDVLTPDDVRVLAESEDERCRQGEFERVFPSPASSRYLRFFEHPRYLNILLNQWEQKFCQNRGKGIELLRSLCQKKVHLGNLDDSAHHWSSKSYHGHRSDSHNAVKTELTKSSVMVSQSVRPQLDDDDWSDHEVQSVTSSLPDMSLLGSVSPSPSPSPSLAGDSLLHRNYL